MHFCCNTSVDYKYCNILVLPLNILLITNSSNDGPVYETSHKITNYYLILVLYAFYRSMSFRRQSSQNLNGILFLNNNVCIVLKYQRHHHFYKYAATLKQTSIKSRDMQLETRNLIIIIIDIYIIELQNC